MFLMLKSMTAFGGAPLKRHDGAERTYRENLIVAGACGPLWQRVRRPDGGVRGGTELHNLFFTIPGRYSELVQCVTP